MAKITGSKIEYADERIMELMTAYDHYIATCRHIRMSEVFNHIVNQPCSRFWVSTTRAAIIIAQMLRGSKLQNMRSTKREMFCEIFTRVMSLRNKFPDISLHELVSRVIMQPAPKFYLTPSSAKIMVYKAKKEWYRRKMRRLSRS